MKQKIVSIAITLLVFFQMASAQTLVHGGIYNNTTWTLSNSPYLMDGNVVVFPGITLTIEPGVEVKVKENGLSGTQYYLETRGTLNMVGQPGARITFSADTALTTIGSWVGIVVKNSQGGTLNYDYVSISNALHAVNYDSWIPALIELHQSEFRYNAYAVNVGTELIASDCIFIGNQDAIFGWSIFTFHNCVFNNNMAALPIYASSLTINNCSFTNNGLGIALNSGSVNGILVKNTLFDSNSIAFDNANNGLIDSCTFTNNIEALKNTIYLTLRNSNFNNNQTALQLGFGTSVMNCEINDNITGIAIGPIGFGQPMPIIENNRICYNTSYNIDNRTDLNLFIQTNCFCSTDSTLIEAKIFDGYDDISKGLISYAIFDTSCSTVLAYVNKSPLTGLNEDQDADQIELFPNPFVDHINISNSGDYKTYRIITLQGQVLFQGSLNKGMNRINVENCPGGIYLLGLIDSADGKHYYKILRN